MGKVAGRAPAVTVAEIAERVVREYLGIHAGETFLIVVDTNTSPSIPDGLRSAASAIGADAVVSTILPRPRSGSEPPPPVAAAMREADVVLCAASKSLYHTKAKGLAHRRGVRGVFNAPPREENWVEGAMTADFFAIRRQAERLAALFRTTKRVRVTSPVGTDISMTVEGRAPFGWLTGICRERGEVSALPGGEVSLPPIEGTSNGTIVWETIASDLGLLEEPVRIEVRDGLAVSVTGGDGAARLKEILGEVRDADNIGEIGIGLNPLSRLNLDITEAKKALGTVHLALGDSANEYGGAVECDVHLDGLVMRPSVWFDDRPIVVDGQHVYMDAE